MKFFPVCRQFNSTVSRFLFANFASSQIKLEKELPLISFMCTFYGKKIVFVHVGTKPSQIEIQKLKKDLIKKILKGQLK